MLSLSSVGLTTTTTLQAQAPAQLDATTAQQLDHYGLAPPSVFKSAANLCVNRPHHLRPKTQMSTKAKTAALQQIRFSESPDPLLFSTMSKTTAQTSVEHRNVMKKKVRVLLQCSKGLLPLLDDPETRSVAPSTTVCDSGQT